MTDLEVFLTIVIVVIIVALILYYFFKGSSRQGLSVTRPVESRVDEYLDRRFESLITEWALIRTPVVNRFKEEHEPQLSRDESDAASLQGFEKEIGNTLERLEKRLDALEQELADQGTEGRGKT